MRDPTSGRKRKGAEDAEAAEGEVAEAPEAEVEAQLADESRTSGWPPCPLRSLRPLFLCVDPIPDGKAAKTEGDIDLESGA